MVKTFQEKTAYLYATWFGAGRVSGAPGTVGSLAALPLCWFSILGGYVGVIGMALFVYAVGVWSTRIVLKHETHDPSFVVIDEVVGQLLAFVLIADHMPSLWMFLIGFGLFRFFDIVKVWPASYFDQKVKNATGVMMDDVVAGLYTAMTLFFIHLIF